MKLALLGYPLAHSLSPAMHNAALEASGLSGWRYQALPTAPIRLPNAVAEIRGDEYLGASVTVPHKQAVLPLLDGLTPAAEAIGAVNTLVKRNGRLLGDNTDAAGLKADLAALGVRLSQRPVLVLGAGGAARAVLAGCASAGAGELRVVARRREQAEALQPLAPIHAFDWTASEFMRAGESCALIVNATPLGMWPEVDASPWFEGTPFPPDAFVYDLVYNPAETMFVRQARAAGLRAAAGLGTLVEQGALAFELWTGQPAPRLVMRQAVEQGLFTSEAAERGESP
jgi:shikimate dehydrogenase